MHLLLFLLCAAASAHDCGNFSAVAAGSTCTAQWRDIKKFMRPTQEAVGYAWLQYKLNHDFSSAQKAQEQLDSSPVPVVLGPGGFAFLVDDHHTLASLDYSGYSSTIVTVPVLCDYSRMSAPEFWSLLPRLNFALLWGRPAGQPNRLPAPIAYQEVPSYFDFSIQGKASMQDDPWRSLSGYVRKHLDPTCPSSSKYCMRGYDRVCSSSGSAIPFFEFRWGYFMDFAFANNTFWAGSQADAFRASYLALTPHDVGGYTEQAWVSVAADLIPLLRSTLAGAYRLPADMAVNYESPALPGYVAGMVPIPHDDADCATSPCPKK